MGTLGINIAVADANVELPAPERAGESFTFAGVTKDVMTATTSIGSACNTMNWFLNMLFPDVIKEAESKEIGIFELLEQKLEGRDVTPVEFYPYLMGTFYNEQCDGGIFQHHSMYIAGRYRIVDVSGDLYIYVHRDTKA